MQTAFMIQVLAALLVLVGIAGVILPALPGVPLVFLGLLLSAWADDFVHVGWPVLVVLGVMTLISLWVDFFSSALGAKSWGASRLAIAGCVLGSLAGLFFMPIGLLAGPFLGALIGEYIHSQRLVHAAKVGMATWLGIAIGIALKMALVLGMLVLFALGWWL